jgi:hypothetical protein
VLHLCFLLLVHFVLSLHNSALSFKPGPIMSLSTSIIIIMIINIIVFVISEHSFFHQSHFMLVYTGCLLNVFIRNYDVLIVITCDFVSYFHLNLTSKEMTFNARFLYFFHQFYFSLHSFLFSVLYFCCLCNCPLRCRVTT